MNKMKEETEKSIIATSANSISQFDAELTSALAGLYLPVIEKYHRATFKGMENTPVDTPFVAVGNHGGVHFMPEALLWITNYHAQKRAIPMLTLTKRKLHHLARRIHLPVNRLGLVDDTPETALMALESGYAIATYPGSDRDISKSFWDRNKIEFFGNVGYVRAAIASQKPILPVVGCGGGEAVYTVNSGEAIAEKFRLDKLFGIKSWPIFWSFPRGLHTGHLPHFSIPFPTKVELSILPPVSVSEFKPEDADDPSVVYELNNKVIAMMQEELDRLAKGRIPVIG